MRRFLLPTLAVVAAGTVAVGTVTIAQTASPSADHAGWRRPDPAMFAAMEKRRGDDLALLIGLTPAQRPSLDQMMAAIRPHGREWGGKDGQSAGPPQDESFTAKLDDMSAGIDARAAAEKAKLDTVKRFYAGLSPDQKQRFDALERLKHSDMGHEMHGHGGTGGHGDMPPPPPGE